jgi:hypothetical protein
VKKQCLAVVPFCAIFGADEQDELISVMSVVDLADGL